MRIFISAGEASGDAYGAALVEEIKRLSGKDTKSFHNVFGREVKDTDTLEAIGLEDSLDAVEYIMGFEDEFGIDIPDDEIKGLRTVGDVRNYIERKTGKRHSFEPAPMTFEAIGGPKLKAVGVTIHADSSHWGAISIAQGIRVGFGILPHYWRVKRLLKKGSPGLFIPIDFGFANIRLAAHAKKQGWKVLYFVPPGSWRRQKQGKDLPQITHEIVTPFEWSAEMLNKMGAKAHWFGHPIKQLLQRSQARQADHGERKTIAVLPGSRIHEVEHHLPLIAKVVGDHIDGQLEFALAPALNVEEVKQVWNRLLPGRNDLFTVADTSGVLQRAKAGIVCSGTATLEAALCHCPMVVVYILSPAMIREAKLLRIRRPRFVSLPNIILDREVVPEYAGVEFVDPVEVRAGLQAILAGGDALDIQMKAFEELDTLLGPDDAITKTAELALRMMSVRSDSRPGRS